MFYTPNAIITTSKLVVCSDPRRVNNVPTPVRGTESLTSHHYHRQPLTVAVYFCLFPFATRKRFHVFFDGYLILCKIFFQLILNVFSNHTFIFSNRIDIILSAPKVSISILILQICMSIQCYQCAFTLGIIYKLCYT